jgi:hypothetical protein
MRRQPLRIALEPGGGGAELVLGRIAGDEPLDHLAHGFGEPAAFRPGSRRFESSRRPEGVHAVTPRVVICHAGMTTRGALE